MKVSRPVGGQKTFNKSSYVWFDFASKYMYSHSSFYAKYERTPSIIKKTLCRLALA